MADKIPESIRPSVLKVVDSAEESERLIGVLIGVFTKAEHLRIEKTNFLASEIGNVVKALRERGNQFYDLADKTLERLRDYEYEEEMKRMQESSAQAAEYQDLTHALSHKS